MDFVEPVEAQGFAGSGRCPWELAYPDRVKGSDHHEEE
jgi:hypothetical protein